MGAVSSVPVAAAAESECALVADFLARMIATGKISCATVDHKIADMPPGQFALTVANLAAAVVGGIVVPIGMELFKSWREQKRAANDEEQGRMANSPKANGVTGNLNSNAAPGGAVSRMDGPSEATGSHHHDDANGGFEMDMLVKTSPVEHVNTSHGNASAHDDDDVSETTGGHGRDE